MIDVKMRARNYVHILRGKSGATEFVEPVPPALTKEWPLTLLAIAAQVSIRMVFSAERIKKLWIEITRRRWSCE